MVFKRKKQLTIKELQKSIQQERIKVKQAQRLETKQIEKSKLKKELFQLQHKKAIATGGKGVRLLRKAGKGIIRVGRKAVPIVKKQARLIRDQQLRDDALARKLPKKKTDSLKQTRTITKFIPIKKKGKKGFFKKVKVRVKSPIPQPKSKKKSQGFNIFENLDF